MVSSAAYFFHLFILVLVRGQVGVVGNKDIAVQRLLADSAQDTILRRLVEPTVALLETMSPPVLHGRS